MRCKKGTHKNKKTGECEPKKTTQKNVKRCANGTRRNKKTKICESTKKIEILIPNKSLAKKNNMEIVSPKKNLNWKPNEYEVGDYKDKQNFRLSINKNTHSLQINLKMYLIRVFDNNESNELNDDEIVYVFSLDKNDSILLYFLKNDDNTFELYDIDGDYEKVDSKLRKVVEFNFDDYENNPKIKFLIKRT
jgi:hypothetical protein